MKFKGIFLAAILTSVLCISGNLLAYSGGTGEPNNPYQIADANNLLALAADTNDYNKCFILTADIDLQGQVWTTAIIAPDTSPDDWWFQGTAFAGKFDGNGHKITNFTINGGSNDHLGLFGQINSGGAIKNLGLENCDVSGYSSVGGLVAENDGSISNCYSMGTVSGYSSVGGLVGLNGLNYGGSISNCYSTGAVSGSSGSNYVGGLVGNNYCGSILDCYSTGAVSGYSSVGGLVGENYGIIRNCYSTGAVSGSSYVGGLVGDNEWASIRNCYSTGTVSGSSYVGGLVGANYSGSISDCYSTGAVGGPGSYYVGGLVGYYYSNYYGSISNCYSTGAVGGPGSYYFGGLVGYYYGSGIIISGCYFLIASGPDNGCGEPLTDEQMKQQASFIGWDFVGETANGTSDFWRMCMDGVDYPHLNWESIAGDFACPDGVNMEDLSYFVQRWLLSDCALSNNCGGADINVSGTVDMMDFAIMAQHWLEGI